MCWCWCWRWCGDEGGNEAGIDRRAADDYRSNPSLSALPLLADDFLRCPRRSPTRIHLRRLANDLSDLRRSFRTGRRYSSIALRRSTCFPSGLHRSLVTRSIVPVSIMSTGFIDFEAVS